MPLFYVAFLESVDAAIFGLPIIFFVGECEERGGIKVRSSNREAASPNRGAGRVPTSCLPFRSRRIRSSTATSRLLKGVKMLFRAEARLLTCEVLFPQQNLSRVLSKCQEESGWPRKTS